MSTEPNKESPAERAHRRGFDSGSLSVTNCKARHNCSFPRYSELLPRWYYRVAPRASIVSPANQRHLGIRT